MPSDRLRRLKYQEKQRVQAKSIKGQKKGNWPLPTPAGKLEEFTRKIVT